MSFTDIAIVSVKANDYRIHFWYMSKDEAINLLRNTDFTEKSRTSLNINISYHLKKMNKDNITFYNTEAGKHKFHRYKSLTF